MGQIRHTGGSQHFIRHCKSSSIKERSDPNVITMFNIHIEYKVKCDICWKEYDNRVHVFFIRQLKSSENQIHVLVVNIG